MNKKYIAEFIGTFALASIVGLSVSGNLGIATPFLAALVLGLFVCTCARDKLYDDVIHSILCCDLLDRPKSDSYRWIDMSA